MNRKNQKKVNLNLDWSGEEHERIKEASKKLKLTLRKFCISSIMKETDRILSNSGDFTFNTL